MALKSLDASLVLVIPNLDEAIVSTRDKVRLVTAVVKVDAVDSLLVALECKVWRG